MASVGVLARRPHWFRLPNHVRGMVSHELSWVSLMRSRRELVERSVCRSAQCAYGVHGVVPLSTIYIACVISFRLVGFGVNGGVPLTTVCVMCDIIPPGVLLVLTVLFR
eukprot:1191705-Prorocentrum_minimum.AAC.1